MTVRGGTIEPPRFVATGKREEWHEVRLRDDSGNAIILDFDLLEDEPGEGVALRGCCCRPRGRKIAQECRGPRHVAGVVVYGLQCRQFAYQPVSVGEVRLFRQIAPFVELSDPRQPPFNLAPADLGVVTRITGVFIERDDAVDGLLRQPERP